MLEEQTGERFGNDVWRWQQWIWQRPYDPHPDYARFKRLWYGQINPLFSEFFPPNVTSLIRLDEVDWGGVLPNGIPPLEYPEHLAAADAEYLDDDNIVFGIAVNGDARAYPKRILAWHEMAVDRVGGLELTIVYRTSGQRFERRLDDFRVAAADGRVGRITEDELVAVDDAGIRLARLPANRAFWFGWFAQFPQTELFAN